jgi:ribosomal protein S18 acetylase RimI-like enzyme
MPRLRPYRADDWASYLTLDLETALISLHSMSADDEEKLRARWPAVLKERCGWTDAGPTTDASSVFVLESDEGAYAGHLWVSEQKDFFSGAPKLWVTTVAVAAPFRGRGWGRLLMEKAVEEARRRGIPTVGLGLDARNERAQKLYASMGFAVTRMNMELRVSE